MGRRVLRINTAIAILIFLVWLAITIVGEGHPAAAFAMVVPSALWILPPALALAWAAAKRDRAASVIGVVNCLFAGLLLLGWNFPKRPSAAPNLRVMTYNVQHFKHYSVDEVARAIIAQDPDVVLLQEAKKRPGFLELMAPYHACSDNGRIILSRFPIRSWRQIALPPRPSWSALLATVDVRGQDVNFVSVHLIPSRVDDTLVKKPLQLGHEVDEFVRDRGEQLRHLHEALDGLRGPIVLGGDFNALPLGREHARLTHRFTDAFANVGSGWGFTAPTAFPLRRIDFLFTSSEVAPVRAQVPRVIASDHLPLVVDLHLGPPQNR
jgi:endonuclease/exonuclease/phosphatase (EEP) superfamily protein YafD